MRGTNYFIKRLKERQRPWVLFHEQDVQTTRVILSGPDLRGVSEIRIDG